MTEQVAPFNGNQSDWLSITQNAVKDGEGYFNAGVRLEIEQDVRQFQGLHPQSSKYLSDAWKARSKFFSPKTRSVIRKNEAVAAAAFFSNTDVVEVTPWDDSDKMQEGGARLMKEWLNLRLRRTITWFQTAIGAYQEAQVNGIVCMHPHWKNNAKKGIDEPAVDLVPIENIVISAASSWIDPVNTSPFFIHKIPMYVKDVMARMDKAPEKGDMSKWNQLTQSQILAGVKSYTDSIRMLREQGRSDSQAQATTLTPYQMVWVYRTIADIDGEDYMWYSLGETNMLSKTGTPLKDAYWHGMRPYVIGSCVIEAHKIYPPGVARITRDLQGELNENRNQRSDNVKFAMNKRYFAKRGAQVDIRSLTRNVPSSVTLMNNPDGPNADVKVLDTPDVTSSAFQEQDRLNIDFDEIAGSVSKSADKDPTNLANKVGGAEMLSEDANQIQGYQLRTFTETGMEPVLYQLMLLGQHYETDEDILKLCGQKADLEKLGITDISDALIMQDLSLQIHVGIGATSPRKQLDNLMFALKSLKEILEGNELQQLGLDIEAVAEEIFGKLGYKSADRFFQWDNQDPNLVTLQNQVAQLTQELANKKDPPEIVAAKVQLIQAQVKKTLADAFNVNVEGLFGSMQAAEVVAAVPATAPVADTIAKAAGYEVPSPPGIDPGIQPAGAAGAQAPVGAQPAQLAGGQGGPAASPGSGAGVGATPPPASPGLAGQAGPAAGVSIDPKGIKNAKTGVVIHPGAAPVQPGLPPGVDHNTHPLDPARPASADVGAHAGVEGGGDHAHKLMMAMHSTLRSIDGHLSKPAAPRPGLTIHTPAGGKYRVEPDQENK